MAKTIITFIIGLGIVLTINGCSAIEVVTGADYGSMDHSLNNADKPLSKKEKVEFIEGKSYVVYAVGSPSKHYAHPSALYKIVDGKVVLAGLVRELPGRLVMEVEAGKHTYMQNSSCDPYTITIDVKKGYVYYIIRGAIRKPSLMAYCRSQGRFLYEKRATEADIFDTYDNYALIVENKAIADELIANTRLQSQYNSFIENIDDKRMTIHSTLSSDKGIAVKDR